MSKREGLPPAERPVDGVVAPGGETLTAAAKKNSGRWASQITRVSALRYRPQWDEPVSRENSA